MVGCDFFFAFSAQIFSTFYFCCPCDRSRPGRKHKFIFTINLAPIRPKKFLGPFFFSSSLCTATNPWWNLGYFILLLNKKQCECLQFTHNFSYFKSLIKLKIKFTTHKQSKKIKQIIWLTFFSGNSKLSDLNYFRQLKIEWIKLFQATQNHVILCQINSKS